MQLNKRIIMQDLNITLDRSKSNSEKWNKELLERHFGKNDILPFWVADMDFEVAEEIKNELLQRAQNGIFGYEVRNDFLTELIINWYKKKHSWLINKEEIRFCSDILNSIAALINIHTKKGDSIIIQPPVFFHFKQLIKDNEREVLTNPLKNEDNKYEMDFEDLKSKASNPKAKMLILCNPHNPIGRVWNKKELEQLSEICLKNNVLIVSDEIHSEIIFGNNKFIPISSLSNKIANNSITCFSPAKSFNIASVTDSVVVIKNEKYRQEFDAFTKKLSLGKLNTFNIVAMEIAYSEGEHWLNHIIKYLEENLEYMKQYIKENIPKVKIVDTQGTFLVWLDFRELGLEVKELDRFLVQDAKVALNSGYWFGREGAGYARMTFACSREMLTEGLNNLAKAIKKIS